MSDASHKTDNDSNRFANQDEIMLGVLTAIQRDSNISQRTISRELGVALGLANAYLKRCIRRGWIKVQQVPRRRYVYYLTPQGFAEKSRLAAEYLSSSFTFFRRARAQMSDVFQFCADNGWRRVAFAGISEFAEVGTLCAHEFSLELVGIVDPLHAEARFCGLPVRATLAECGPVDAVIVTSLVPPEVAYGDGAGEIARERVLAPYYLRMALAHPAELEPMQAAQ
jgi:DNA-binding MarR family transcriptional regulator